MLVEDVDITALRLRASFQYIWRWYIYSKGHAVFKNILQSNFCRILISRRRTGKKDEHTITVCSTDARSRQPSNICINSAMVAGNDCNKRRRDGGKWGYQSLAIFGFDIAQSYPSCHRRQVLAKDEQRALFFSLLSTYIYDTRGQTFSFSLAFAASCRCSLKAVASRH